MANNNVKVGTITLSGKVFSAPELREGTYGKFATLKMSKNNGKIRGTDQWAPSTFTSVLLQSNVAVKKDTGAPSWLVEKLTKGTAVTFTGRLEVGAYLDKTQQPVPTLSLVVSSFEDVVVHNGGEAQREPGDDSLSEETPFL